VYPLKSYSLIISSVSLLILLPGSSSMCYQWAVIALSDHPRWMFRKNSMEFFVRLLNYLYYFYKWLYTTNPQSHVLLECSMITWPCHMIWLSKFPYYLYLDSVVWLDITDQVFKCMGNYFLFGALITLWSRATSNKEIFSVYVSTVHCLL